MNILHAPLNVGGNPSALARAERAIGLDSVSVSFMGGPYGLDADEVHSAAALGRFRFERNRRRLLRRAVEWADVVHFNFGLSFMPQRVPLPAGGSRMDRFKVQAFNAYAAPLELRDLKVLKDAGVRIVMTYQGSDIRPPTGDAPGAARLRSWQAERVAMVDRYADHIYALNPDLLAYLPDRARFLPYASMDVPVAPAPVPAHEGIRIVHAPSHRGIKGTAQVEAAVATLKAEGLPVHLEILEGVPHAEVLSAIAGADIVVDQLKVGWYGALGLEGLAAGRPTACWIDPQHTARAPEGFSPEDAFVVADGLTIEDRLRELIQMAPDARERRGEAGHAFARKWHDPEAIVQRLLREAYTA